MKEQLATPVRIVGAEPVGLCVGRHVHPEQPHLAVDDPGVGVLQSDPPGAEGLHLRALQGDAALDASRGSRSRGGRGGWRRPPGWHPLGALAEATVAGSRSTVLLLCRAHAHVDGSRPAAVPASSSVNPPCCSYPRQCTTRWWRTASPACPRKPAGCSAVTSPPVRRVTCYPTRNLAGVGQALHRRPEGASSGRS